MSISMAMRRLSFTLSVALLVTSCGGPMPSESAGNSSSVEDPVEPADYDLVVFFGVDAPQESIDAVEQLLLGDSEVQGFWFVSPEMAQEEYETMFGEQAGVALPASFRIFRQLRRIDDRLLLVAGNETALNDEGFVTVQSAGIWEVTLSQHLADLLDSE